MAGEVRIDAQVHGYRHGHQLISTSLELPRADQDRLDQLSDLAGPLRPGEVFEPYTSAYPLPSGKHYVLARTWQDTTVPRAGCVRTLSLLIPSDDWAHAPDLQGFLNLLNLSSLPLDAHPTTVRIRPETALPPVTSANGSELLEALFLEESQPVAVFDCPERQLVATRLLTALWPSGRAQFSLSTFALSPRRIGPNYFNLVFAPLDARPRFSDWQGRRVDGRATQALRHRWTAPLVHRVFFAPHPALLEREDEELLDGGFDADPAAALRIALLWDELLDKVRSKPTAILGLLDIANSRKVEKVQPVLAPILESSTNRVVDELEPSEAWDFIGAVVKKLGRPSIKAELELLGSPVSRLVAKDPVGAVQMVCSLEADASANALVARIADSLAKELKESTASRALILATSDCLWKLLTLSERLVKSSLEVPELVPAVAEALVGAPSEQFARVAATMLPSLRADYHLPVARTVFQLLDRAQVVAKAVQLASQPSLGEALVQQLFDRGRAIQALDAVRSALLNLSQVPTRDRLLEATLCPSSEDVRWLLYEPRLYVEQATDMLDRLLSRASHDDRLAIFRDSELASSTAARVKSREILYWLLMHAALPLDDQISLALALSRDGDTSIRTSAAAFGLSRALQIVFRGDEVATTALLMERAAEGGDLKWAIDAGLGSRQANGLLNRNLEAFDKLSISCRRIVLENISHVAKALSARYSLDLDRSGAEALAHLIWDSEAVNPPGHLEACGLLLPSLLRATQLEVSILIVATFPTVYQELGRRDQVPDFLNFMPFYDWNRCKAARANLVESFLASSVWPPADLALTACLSGDARRILGRLQKSFRSHEYIERLMSSIHELPAGCQGEVIQTLARTKT